MDLTTLEQHAMLAIMALQPSAYGISIQSHIGQKAGYEPSVGSIYAALDRLEREGLCAIETRRGDRRERRPPKTLLFSDGARSKSPERIAQSRAVAEPRRTVAGGAGMSLMLRRQPIRCHDEPGLAPRRGKSVRRRCRAQGRRAVCAFRRCLQGFGSPGRCVHRRSFQRFGSGESHDPRNGGAHQ